MIAGRRGHARDDLPLQHEVLVEHRACGGQQVEQDRRRDVVGQVADDAQLAAPPCRQRREVDAEHVGFDDFEHRVLAQPRREVAVEFDDGEVLAALDQRQRQRAEPGADLDQRLAGPRVDRRDDVVEDAGSARKCWPKRFLGWCFTPLRLRSLRRSRNST